MAPNTVWSAVWMVTVGPPGTVIVTLALAVAPSLSVTVKVRVTTRFAAVVPGAIQVASSTVGSLNVPAVAVHRRVATVPADIRGRGFKHQSKPLQLPPGPLSGC